MWVDTGVIFHCNQPLICNDTIRISETEMSIATGNETKAAIISEQGKWLSLPGDIMEDIDLVVSYDMGG